MRSHITLSSVISLLVVTHFATASVINVPDDQPTVQAGIEAAATGDTVLVHPGTYIENINFNGKNVTLGSLFLTTGEQAYISQTVIDGDSAGSVVSFENGESSSAVLAGLTVTNGGGFLNGGGILCSGSSPTLEHLVVTGNQAIVGGGVYCENYSNPILRHSLISYNFSSYSSGGGMACDSSDPYISDVEFAGNISFGSGGAIDCTASSPTIENVTMNGNSASFGGGIGCWYGSNPVLTDVTISGNDGGVHGGGVFCKFSSSPTFRDMTVSGNVATYGGGFSLVENCSPTIEKVAILDNTALTSAGAISCGNGSDATLINVTASGNTAVNWGSAMYIYDSHPFLVNTILWNGPIEEIWFSVYNETGSITISHSDIQFGEDGIVTNENADVYWLNGNMDEDPLFVDPENADYQLSPLSPCVDRGDPAYEVPLGGACVIDMGAYELWQGIVCHKTSVQLR